MRCTLEQPTCSRWQRTGAVRKHTRARLQDDRWTDTLNGSKAIRDSARLKGGQSRAKSKVRPQFVYSRLFFFKLSLCYEQHCNLRATLMRKPALSVYVCVRVLAAGNAFCQAARLHMQLQNKLDSATSFVDAGNAYKKADPQGEKRRPCSTVIPGSSCQRRLLLSPAEAISCLNQAIDIYTDMVSVRP